jgi:hypothetical protein
MVVPAKVASTTQGSAMLRKLPLRLQRYIVNRGARTLQTGSFTVRLSVPLFEVRLSAESFIKVSY